MNNNKPLISTIMSVYNDSSRVKTAIESILNQDFEDFEFLIMDDGSSDSTPEVLTTYKNIDSRVKIFKNSENIGLTKSLNILLDYSEGKYIARQDSDDTSSSKRFLEQLNFIKNNDLVGCSTRANIYKKNKLIPGLSLYIPLKKLISYKNPIIHGSVILEKEAYLKYNGYDENFYYAQDYKLFYEIIKNNEKFKILNKPLYTLNTIDNISTKNLEEQNYYAECVKKGVTPNKDWLN
jgi:glycosyltransferase involved in cell wall biosynthesis